MKKFQTKHLSFFLLTLMIVAMTLGALTVGATAPTSNNNVIVDDVDYSDVEGESVACLAGSGTEEYPYVISSKEDLFFFAEKVNDGTYKNAYIVLGADIDLEQYDWTSIGTFSNPFTGTFDGQGYSISNIWSYERGLFGYTSTGNYVDSGTNGRATIKNLVLENVTVINQSTSAVGGLVGQANQNTEITNVTVKGEIQIFGYGYVGGIVGQGYVHVDNCHVDGGSFENSISAFYWAVGGIVGHAGGEGGASITNCSVKNVTIDSTIYGAGAIAGVGTKGPIENVSADSVNVIAQSDPDANGLLVGCNYNKITSNSIAKNTILTVAGNQIVVPQDMVAKVGNTYCATLQAAIEAVAENGTITLLANIVFTEETRTHNSGTWYDGLYYQGDKSFTIDLGGFTITHDGSVNDYLLNFKNVGSKANTITIKNGTVDAGTVAYCAICTSSVQENQLTLNLENVNVINNISNGSTIKVRGGVILNVKDGTVITGKNSYLGIECIASTVNIYDGAEIYMNGTGSYNGCLVGVGSGGTVNVYGGYGKGVKGGFIAMTSGGTINISGGEWIANTDGTVGADSNYYVLTAQSNKNESGFVGASIINVTGGAFRGGMDAWVLNNIEGEKAEINISGGNFNADPSSYVEAGYVVKENNGVFTLAEAVAKVGTTYYATLAEAIAAAQNGDAITLLADIVLTEGVTVPAGKTITLDLNGKTISASISNKLTKSFALITNKGTLTIKDSVGAGKISLNYTSETFGYGIGLYTISNEGGTLNIERGRIENLATVSGSMYDAIDNNSTLGNTYLNIKGGEISCAYLGIRQFANSTTYVNVVNVSDGKVEGGNSAIWMQNPVSSDVKADVKISGGDIVGRILAGESSAFVVAVSGGTFTVAVPEDFCAKGYVPKNNNDGTYGVKIGSYVAKVGEAKYETLAEAIAAAQAGDTITLIRDVTLSEIVKIEKKITLDLGGKKVTSTAQKAFEIYANATIQNGTIEGVNRCVDTRKAVELTLTGVTLVADKYSAYGNPQPLTIGGSTNGTKVTMNEVTIDAGTAGYGIITFVKTELTATDSTISGYSALYVKPGSEGSTFDFENCDLSGSTVNNDVEGNSFSTIAVRANSVTVNVDADSTVTATGKYSYAISLGGEYAGEESVTGAKVTVAGEITGNILPKAPENTNVVAVKSTYANALKAAGYAVSDAENGMISVIGVIDEDNLLDIIEKAKPGDIIALGDNVVLADTTIVLNKGITLDLNGYTLTVDYLVAFKGNHVVDNSNGKGLLVVKKDNLSVGKNNSQMPIWIGDETVTDQPYGYKFAKVTLQGVVEERTAEELKLKVRPGFNQYIYDVLISTSDSTAVSNSGLKVMIRISWIDVNNRNRYQDFVCDSDELRNLYESNKNKILLTVTGLTDNHKNVTASLIVTSEIGVEVFGTDILSQN